MQPLSIKPARFFKVTSQRFCFCYRRTVWRVAHGFFFLLWAVCSILSLFAQDRLNKFPEFTVDASRNYLRTVAQQVFSQSSDREGIHFIIAQTQSQFGLKEEAEKTARLGLEKNPKQLDLLVFLADLFMREGRLDEGRLLLERARRLEPANASISIRLGRLLSRIGESENARKSYISAIKIAPNNYMPFLLLGQSLIKEGLYKDGLGHLEKACKLAPEESPVHYALWRVQMRLGRQDEAEKHRSVFETLKREDMAAADKVNAKRNNEEEMRGLAASFHLKMARFYLGTKKDEQMAESHFRQAVRVAPQLAAAHHLLATFYLRCNRPLQAKFSFEQLVELQPNHAGYRTDLGTLLLQTKDYAVGVKELRRALTLDPDQPQALHNLARFYLGRGKNPAAALPLCQRLVQKRPNARNYDLFAWACFANGQVVEAISAAAEAVRRDPNNHAYKTRLQKLKHIR